MENLADFKKFVQSRPELSEAVKNQEYTWQGIYEMYALYGPDHAIWQDFKGKSVSSAGGGLDIASLLNLVRNLDLDALASALSGLSLIHSEMCIRDSFKVCLDSFLVWTNN